MLNLKKEIISLCNNSGLPLEAVMFVLKDAYRDAEYNLLLLDKSKEEKTSERKKEEE